MANFPCCQPSLEHFVHIICQFPKICIISHLSTSIYSFFAHFSSSLSVASIAIPSGTQISSAVASDMLKADYKELKNGTKTLADLKSYFWNGKRDGYVLGLEGSENYAENINGNAD